MSFFNSFYYFFFFLMCFFFFFNDTATTEIYTLSLHDALPIPPCWCCRCWASNPSTPPGPRHHRRHSSRARRLRVPAVPLPTRPRRACRHRRGIPAVLVLAGPGAGEDRPANRSHRAVRRAAGPCQPAWPVRRADGPDQPATPRQLPTGPDPRRPGPGSARAQGRRTARHHAMKMAWQDPWCKPWPSGSGGKRGGRPAGWPRVATAYCRRQPLAWRGSARPNLVLTCNETGVLTEFLTEDKGRTGGLQDTAGREAPDSGDVSSADGPQTNGWTIGAGLRIWRLGFESLAARPDQQFWPPAP